MRQKRLTDAEVGRRSAKSVNADILRMQNGHFNGGRFLFPIIAIYG
jgi:hypothetical protein